MSAVQIRPCPFDKFLADNKTGFLVNNVDEAVEAIGKLDQINRTDCRKRVEEHFTIDCMAAVYEEVYEEILRKKAKKNK